MLFHNVLLRRVQLCGDRYNHWRKTIYRRSKTLCEFFGGRYALPHLFHRLLKKEYVRLNNTLYQLCYNSHPECQRIKMQLVKGLGIEDPGLWRICPKEYRHLLHDERRQELKNRKVDIEQNIV